MLRIMFTGGGGAGNEAIWRFWCDRYELHFADASAQSFAPTLPASRCHVIPYANEASFESSLANLCARLDIDVLVPGVDEELPKIGQLTALHPTLRILVPGAGYVSAMQDKLNAMAILRDGGIDAPRTTTLDRAELIGFPCFAKPRRGRGSRGITVLRNAAAGNAYLALSGLSSDELVVQELVTGQEYTVLVSADASARLHAIVPVRVDEKRGITISAETEANTKVVSACAKMHDVLPTSGCYNVQLFVTPEGRVRPFEINPRISTTFCLGVAAGIDPIANYLSETPPHGLLPFRSGLKLRRYWINYIG